MKIPTSVLVGILFLVGLLCGIVGRRFIPSRAAERPPEQVVSGSKEEEMVTIPRGNRSKDSVETLLALDGRQLYSRLAHWLLDASEEELIIFRNAYRQAGDKDYEIGRLTLVHWARLNPQAAVTVSSEAEAGEQESYERWQAWAIHDPEAALASDAAAGGKMAPCIWHAIAVFHPRWFVANFDRVPYSVREGVISSMNAQADVSVIAEKSLEVAERWNHSELLDAVFVNTLKNSPLEAWEWYQRHKTTHPDFFSSESNVIDYITSYTAKPAQAGELVRIAESMEAGDNKWTLGAKAVELLSQSDPEAALAMARRSGTGGVRDRLLAAVGKALVFDQPDKALEIADEILAGRSGLPKRPEVRFANHTREAFHSEDDLEINDFLKGLCIKRPEQLMQTLLKHDSALGGGLMMLADTWARQSPESYADWLGTQADPRILGPGVDAMASILTEKKRYPDALDWAISAHATDSKKVAPIFKAWYRSDPDAADAWLKNSDLPEEREQQLLKAVKK